MLGIALSRCGSAARIGLPVLVWFPWITHALLAAAVLEDSLSLISFVWISSAGILFEEVEEEEVVVVYFED